MATSEANTISSTAASLSGINQSIATAADTQAAGAVQTLGLIQQARLSHLNRAVTVAVATYGKDSTQAAAAMQSVAATQAANVRLAVTGQQASTPQPTVAAAGWVLHGRVYSSSLTPLSGYCVFLVDAQKNYLSDYGFSYTDSSGYFLISYEGSPSSSGPAGVTADQTSATPPGQTVAESASKEQAAQNKADSAQTTAAASASAISASQIFLQVADPNANPVLLSEITFTPVAGQATYQVVTLPSQTAPLGDPPAAVRAVAMPPIKRKSGK